MPKSRKNAFSHFLESYCAEEEAKGRHISKRDAVNECDPLWTSLPEEGKEIFRIMARREKDNRREASESMPSCSSIWENPKVKALFDEKDVAIYVETKIKDENDARNRFFYTVHANYYCMVDKNNYLPGELAICEFNLQGGITRKMNVLINPGKIPLGFAYEVKKLTTKVHGLPHPSESPPSDLKQIAKEILDFMECAKDEKNNYPPMFTTQLHIEATTNIINELITPGGRQPKFKVYDIEILLYRLNLKCATLGINEPYEDKSKARHDIDKDLYEYFCELCCPYHEVLDDNYSGCSLSHVQRMAFAVCEPCCYLLSIPVIRGNHKPARPPEADFIREVPPEEMLAAAYEGNNMIVDDDDDEDD